MAAKNGSADASDLKTLSELIDHIQDAETTHAVYLSGGPVQVLDADGKPIAVLSLNGENAHTVSIQTALM